MPGPAGRIDARVVVVLGKGGVGKTTAAGALALALADAGEDTHLLSTDPAHSVGDLFSMTLPPGEPVASPCTPRLVLEELDARAWAESWMARVREPLVELFDRGTYLDREDVEGFLDLSLPGVDEVAAALRLAELVDTDVGRVVVDTAPTGHALRLLRADEVVASWTDAFDAMEAKARAVLEGLTRGRVRLRSAGVVEDLTSRVGGFRDAVLRDGAAVVVDREGAVVEAETRRLLQALDELGLDVPLRVRTASPLPASRAGDEPPTAAEPGKPPTGEPVPHRVTIPWRTDLQGCEGLRRWGSEPDVETLPTGAPRGEASETRPGADVVRSLGVGLLLVVGKGGVGKSTCAAATALLLASEGVIGEEGPRTGGVRLLGADPAGSLDDVMNGPGRLPAGLTVAQVDAEAGFERVRERYRDDVNRAFDSLTSGGGDATLDRRVVRSFMNLAPPGIDEIFALLALLEDAEDETLVVDTAPTGHALRLLALPDTALAWTRQLLRTIRKYRAALGLDAFAETLLDFAKRLKDLNLRLTDPDRSAALVVTQPGTLVAAETARLLDTLRDGGIPVGAVLRNRWSAGIAGEVLPPSGVPVVRAPTVSPSPGGPDALLAFARIWELEP